MDGFTLCLVGHVKGCVQLKQLAIDLHLNNAKFGWLPI